MLVSCRKCGASASDKAEACPKCGAGAEAMLGLAKPCPECSQTIREGFPSCPACGLPAASFGGFHRFPNAMATAPPGPPPPPAPPPQPQQAQTQQRQPASREKSGAGGLIAVIGVVALVGAIIWGMSQANQNAVPPAPASTPAEAAPAAALPEVAADPPAAPAELTPTEQAERDLLDDPVTGAFLAEFKSLFPSDYDDVVLSTLREASFLSRSEIEERILDSMFDFQSRNLTSLLSADSYSLADLAERSAAAMRTPRLCQMAVSGDYSGMDYVDPAGQQALVEQDLALIRAIASGRSYGAPRGDPTVDQEVEFERLMSERLTEAQMNAVMDGSVEFLALEQQCPIMSAIWDTVAGMPTDASAFWTAQLFRAALENPAPR